MLSFYDKIKANLLTKDKIILFLTNLLFMKIWRLCKIIKCNSKPKYKIIMFLFLLFFWVYLDWLQLQTILKLLNIFAFCAFTWRATFTSIWMAFTVILHAFTFLAVTFYFLLWWFSCKKFLFITAGMALALTSAW